ncbi:hypothetical protein KW798_00855 [Candidatus Parcubacteria bacterium]|nr:hypothetical protein [Candidatus Parcubacteria bacterium]
MEALPLSIIATIAILTLFLCLLLVLKYAITSNFIRARLIMTAFFWFIVATLTLSFGQYFFATLPYAVPAGFLGMIVGYFIGVREAEQRLMMEGLEHYMEHFAHIHSEDLKHLTWWSVVNFYSVAGALVLINFVGFTNVIMGGSERGAIITSAVGAFLLGTIFPYLAHLWSINTRHHPKSTTNEPKNI